MDHIQRDRVERRPPDSTRLHSTATPSLTASSDRELVERFRGGSRAAYEMIYKTYRRSVTATCRRYLADERDVDEAVQDTFVRAYAALDRFNGEFRLGGWLNRIARNVAIDIVRRRARNPHTAAIPLTFDRPDSAPTPDEVVGLELLHPALDQLSTEHARALRLRAHGYSHTEIGEMMNRSPSQVKALLHRARTAFKRAAAKLGTGAALMLFAFLGYFWLRLIRSLSPTVARVSEATIRVADAIAVPVASVTADVATWITS